MQPARARHAGRVLWQLAAWQGRQAGAEATEGARALGWLRHLSAQPLRRAPLQIHAPRMRAPQVAEVKAGDLFRVECVDWTGGQIKDDDSAEDIKWVGKGLGWNNLESKRRASGGAIMPAV